MELFDTHTHLYHTQFSADLESVFVRMASAEVTKAMCIGFDLDSSAQALALTQAKPNLWAAVGIHPHDAQEVPPDYLTKLAELLAHPHAVALGEIGLDYYRDLSPRDIQRRVFKEQLALTRDLAIPVIIHARDAFGDLMDILRQDRISPAGGVIHCFSGSWEIAVEAMEMGFYISLAGPVTYNKSLRLHEIAARLPEDRLLIETDCPFLAPIPFRGKRNEPAYVRYIAEYIAELRGITPAELAAITTANACAAFKLPQFS